MNSQSRKSLFNDIGAKVHEVVFVPLRKLPIRRPVSLTHEPGVSVLAVTNRPEQLAHVVSSYDEQRGVDKDLVLVTNSDLFDEHAVGELAARPDITHVRTPASLTLGAALNKGVEVARGDVIAKFDDDDEYGPDYLADAVDHMRRTEAGVVGKKTYFVYLSARDETVLLLPGNQHKRVGRVAGGTIVVHRDVAERVTFEDRNLGEDVRFVRAAERQGFGVYSTQAAGFLQTRHPSGHTWDADETEFLMASTPVGPGRDRSLWT